MAEEWRAMFVPFRGCTDDEISARAKAMGGMDLLTASILNGMAGALDPAKAQDAVIGYRLTDSDRDHVYAIAIEGTTATVEPRDPDDARITYVLSAQDFIRLLSGDLDGAGAFQSGRVKIEGDQAFALQSQGLFGGS